ncbi:MAG: Type 1 glutamine amidotransferase-like domain-containing protein [Microgenomates group bacterium]
MKLFLASLASETLDLVLPLLPDKPQNLKLAFIPTAADPYGDIPMPWMTADHDKLVSIGFMVTDYDIKRKNVDQLRRDLFQFQVIFVAGGNTFYLLNEAKKSGFHTVIKELVDQGVVYIGASAGSCLLCPTIKHVTLLDHPEQVPELTDYTALNLVPQLIIPHYGREKYRARHEQIKVDYGDKILFLRDDQAIVVNGDKIEIVTNQGDI